MNLRVQLVYMYRFYLLFLICLVGCGNSDAQLKSETAGYIVQWEGISDAGVSEQFEELTVFARDDFKVIFTPGLELSNPESFLIVYSGIHVADCTEPRLSDVTRKALIELRDGNRDSVKIDREFGSSIYKLDRGDEIVISGATHKVRVIRHDAGERIYFDVNSGELLGVRHDYGHTDLMIGIVKSDPIDQNTLDFAKLNCDAGSLEK